MKSRLTPFAIFLLIILLTASCNDQEPTPTIEPPPTAAPTETAPEQPAPTMPPVEPPPVQPTDEPLPELPEFDNLHVPSPNWEEQIIYFLMTDRFNDGDPGNNDLGTDEYDPDDGRKYSGGDFQGIIDQLDYIQGLGATAIWITPPVANMWWDPLVPFGGYHGYWAENFKLTDAHLGTLQDYQALSEALHDRGMYLIQDVVPNHMGNFFTYADENGVNRYQAGDPTANVRFNEEAIPDSVPSQAPFHRTMSPIPPSGKRPSTIGHPPSPILVMKSRSPPFNSPTWTT